MSTLNTTNIKHTANTGDPNLVLDTAGNVVINGDAQMQSQNSGPLAGLRNVLINPGMEISQRYGLNNLQTTANDFAVDRWRCVDGTNYSQQNSTNNWADGFSKHVLINTTGTATLYQHVELPYAGCPAPFGQGTTWTLSGYFAGNGSSIDVQPWVVFTDGLNGTGNQSTVFFPAATTIDSPTSKLVRAEWTFDVGVDPNPSNTSLSVFFICTNTGGSASISGCQLEPGPVATPLEIRPIGMELGMCQRYYSRQDKMRIVGYQVAGQEIAHSVKCSMRANPTATTSNFSLANVANGAQPIPTNFESTGGSLRIVAGGAGTVSAIDGVLVLDAEL